MILFHYWRSGSSHRTRIALALKGIQYESHPVNLLEKEHKTDEYHALNPQGMVPALKLDSGQIITQSPAIIEYLEEAFPDHALLPQDPIDKAQVRAMAAIIGCDIHPLNNLRLLNYVTGPLGGDAPARQAWIAHWITEGFTALEKMIRNRPQISDFCFGPTPTIADCYLIPQIYSAERFEVDLTPFPRLREINAACSELPAFKAAYPVNPQ
ncbi:MAG: maleylacetoacetate isomerase [bacterium]